MFQRVVSAKTRPYLGKNDMKYRENTEKRKGIFGEKPAGKRDEWNFSGYPEKRGKDLSTLRIAEKGRVGYTCTVIRVGRTDNSRPISSISSPVL